MAKKNKQQKIEVIRHSLAHIMAAAVQELFPGTKFGIGPVIENGFYYDFEFVEADLRGTKRGLTTNQKLRFGTGQARITPEGLPRIEGKIRKLIKQNIVFKKKLISKTEAKKIFKNQPYKLELIKEIKGDKVSIYESGKFLDLCKGPHIKSTLQLRSGQALQLRSGKSKEVPVSFKLTKIAGAYWRGSEKNPMLTRIYGVAFKTKRELDDYFRKQEEAGKRDHRILGQKLDLFSFDAEVGTGLTLWHPKGTILRKIIEDFVNQELLKTGYQLVNTPHIGKESLFKTSGHLDFYKENMYAPFEIEKEKYYLRPMNCPFHIKIYKSEIRSYKDLPIRFAEFGTVYRYEKSGVLHGLVRVRGFTQDDAHIFCTPEQLGTELISALRLTLKILKTFGFKKYEVYLSTRPNKYAGELKNWTKATNSLKYALEKTKLKYQIDPGEGVFYGPKIDIKIKDSLGRLWQCTTVQLDFNLPEKFNISYIDKKGKKQRPFMIHRALLGTLERFIGILIEYYSGSFPLWLSPVQIWITPVGSRHRKYAQEIGKKFEALNLRYKVRDESETVSKKIRDGELQKIPYLLVVGDKEMTKNGVRVRERGKGDVGKIKLSKFLRKVREEIEQKK